MTSGTGAASRHVLRLLAGGLAVSAAACAEVPEAAPPVHEPAVVEQVDGEEVSLVRFDAVAAQQVDLQTAPVRAAGRRTVVPYAALIYDPAGSVWVYAVDEPLTFMRREVVVDRVQGGRAWLRDGPGPGTQVVTRGVTEVYGAELGIAGGH